MSTYSDRVASQLKGLETRHVHDLAAREVKRGNRNVFIELLPRRAGEMVSWDTQDTVALNVHAGYVYPADMLLYLTERWLNEYRWTI